MKKNSHKLDYEILSQNPIIAVIDKKRSKFMFGNFD